MSLSSQPEESENENCASAGGMGYLIYELIFVYFYVFEVWYFWVNIKPQCH